MRIDYQKFAGERLETLSQQLRLADDCLKMLAGPGLT